MFVYQRSYIDIQMACARDCKGTSMQGHSMLIETLFNFADPLRCMKTILSGLGDQHSPHGRPSSRPWYLWTRNCPRSLVFVLDLPTGSKYVRLTRSMRYWRPQRICI